MKRFLSAFLVVMMLMSGAAFALSESGSVNEYERYSDFWRRYPDYMTLDGENNFATGSAFRENWTVAMRLYSAGAASYRVANSNAWVPVYAEADTSSSSLASFYPGETVDVTGRWNDWYLCCFGETENSVLLGWVEAKYLVPTSGFVFSAGSSFTAAEDLFGTDSMYVANCEQWVSLRAEADVSSARLAEVPLGARVNSCVEQDDGFTRCVYQGRTGYILSQFLEEQPGYARRWIVNCDEWVSLREAADTSSDRIVKVPLGMSVTQCSVLPNGFSYCEYEGLYGYILTKYLAQKPSAGTTMYIGNCKEWVSLREVAAAGGARLMRLPLGEEVTVYGTLSNGYSLCMARGVYGYVLSEYLVSGWAETGYRYVTNCEEWVSLRAMPDSTSMRLAKVPLGAQVRWLEVLSNGYTRCLYQGTAGYIRTEYLSMHP